MNNWQATFLGLKQLPRELNGRRAREGLRDVRILRAPSDSLIFRCPSTTF
jgi:hypothetical protein